MHIHVNVHLIQVKVTIIKFLDERLQQLCQYESDVKEKQLLVPEFLNTEQAYCDIDELIGIKTKGKIAYVKLYYLDVQMHESVTVIIIVIAYTTEKKQSSKDSSLEKKSRRWKYDWFHV